MPRSSNRLRIDRVVHAVVPDEADVDDPVGMVDPHLLSLYAMP